MNNIIVTLKKELKLIIRDKKSLLMMALTPLFIPIFVILMSYIYEEITTNNEDKKYVVGVNYSLSNIEKELLSKELDIIYYDNIDNIKNDYDKKKIISYIIKDNNNYNIYIKYLYLCYQNIFLHPFLVCNNYPIFFYNVSLHFVHLSKLYAFLYF